MKWQASRRKVLVIKNPIIADNASKPQEEPLSAPHQKSI